MTPHSSPAASDRVPAPLPPPAAAPDAARRGGWRWWAEAAAVGGAVLLFGFVASACWWHLGVGDFRAWDEAAYAWRAKVAVETGDWFDQTDHALQGFYSSAFPPLLIWEMAASFTLSGGYSEWAGRLPVALQSLLLLLATGAVGWVVGGWRTGAVCAIVLGAIPEVAEYSQTAIFDLPTACWAMVAMAALLWPTQTQAGRRVAVYGCGVALGLALMTKIAVGGLIGLAMGATVLMRRLLGADVPPAPAADADTATTTVSGGASPPAEPFARWARRTVGELTIAAGVAAAVWLPWHVAMALHHGQVFWDWYFGYHLIERGTTAIGGDYYSPWTYPFELWRRLPSPLLALFLIATAYAVGVVGTTLAVRLVRPAGTPIPVGHRAIAAALAPGLFWSWFLLVPMQQSVTKRPEYLLIVYPGIALAVGALAGAAARHRQARPVTAMLICAAVASLLLHPRTKPLLLLLERLTNAPLPGEGDWRWALAGRELGWRIGASIVAGVAGAALLALLDRVRPGAAPGRRRATAAATLLLLALFAYWLADEGLRRIHDAPTRHRVVDFQLLASILDHPEQYPAIIYVGQYNPADNATPFLFYLDGVCTSEREPHLNVKPISRRPSTLHYASVEQMRADPDRPADPVVILHRFAAFDGVYLDGLGGEYADHELAVETPSFLVFRRRGAAPR